MPNSAWAVIIGMAGPALSVLGAGVLTPERDALAKAQSDRLGELRACTRKVV